MRGNWLIMLVIAVVFGAIAVVVANRWLAIQQQQGARVVPAEAVETATIVVAAGELGFGKALGPQDLREIPWPKATIPEGYYAKIADVTGAGRRVILFPLGPNEPVLNWKISGPDARGSLSAIVEPGLRAVAIRVNDVVGVAGFVLPGDRVDVLLTRNDDANSQVTDVLLQNVKVLAVNQLANEKANEPTVAKVATLEVTSTDAQKIALAQTVGSLTLSLRAAGSLDQAPARRVVVAELTSSSSVYDEQVAARMAAEQMLNTRIVGMEKNLAQLDKEIQTTGSQAEAALKQREAELKQRITDLQAEFDQRVKASGSRADEALNQRDEELKQRIVALQAEFDQRVKASGSRADEALNQRDEELKQRIVALQAEFDQRVKASGSRADEALNQREEELKQRIVALQAEFDQRVLATGSQAAEALKEQIAAVRADIETKLLASGSQAQEALKQQIAAVQKQLDDKLKASGQDDARLRERLTQLQDALRQSLDASNEGNEALRAKLLALEQSLQQLTGKVIEPKIVEREVVPVVVDETLTVNVIRAMKAQSYSVPRETVAE
jgi:pilus assembly protein CpaB